MPLARLMVPMSRLAHAGLDPTVVVGGRVSTLGGSNARITEVPWQVALLRAGSGSGLDRQFCGGSILSAEWILTAVHAPRARAGYATASAEIWDDRGRLIATATQTMLLRRAPDALLAQA